MGLARGSTLVGARPHLSEEDTMIADFSRTLDSLKDKLQGLRVYL